MTKEKVLKSRLQTIILYDWGTDFDVDIEESDREEEITYYDVIITHENLGVDHEFVARVWNTMSCEMDYGDGTWKYITKESLFVWMWFELALRSTKDPRRCNHSEAMIDCDQWFEDSKLLESLKLKVSLIEPHVRGALTIGTHEINQTAVESISKILRIK